MGFSLVLWGSHPTEILPWRRRLSIMEGDWGDEGDSCPNVRFSPGGWGRSMPQCEIFPWGKRLVGWGRFMSHCQIIPWGRRVFSLSSWKETGRRMEKFECMIVNLKTTYKMSQNKWSTLCRNWPRLVQSDPLPPPVWHSRLGRHSYCRPGICDLCLCESRHHIVTIMMPWTLQLNNRITQLQQ